jgi:nitroreductase
MKQTPDFERIQARMAPGILTLSGFLGNDQRNLADILQADQEVIASAGLTHLQIADRLRELSRQGTDLMEGSVMVENRYRVTVRDDRGMIPCPWGDGLFAKGDTEMTDERTGKQLRWNPLILHMIGTHGFYLGHGSNYRNDPADLLEVLDIRVPVEANSVAFDMMLTRASIRFYTSQTVPEETVEKLLKAAMSAPSAGNQQPWQFVVVRDRSLLERVAVTHPYAAMAAKASVAILVCGDTRDEKFPGFWVQDCSAAVENLLLAAHFLGIGAVWLGIHPLAERVTAFQQLFRLPPEVVPLAMIPCGYPAEMRRGQSRFNPERIHANLWSER